jgi:hypothetical protein
VIRRAFEALPGPLWTRLLISIIVVLALLVALHFIYTWMGDSFLDTGGGIG